VPLGATEAEELGEAADRRGRLLVEEVLVSAAARHRASARIAVWPTA